MRLKTFIVFIVPLISAGLLVLPVKAQVTGEKTGEKKESTSIENPGMEPWKWVNFLILAGGIGYLIKQNAGPLFSGRSAEIREGLEAGKRARAEADARAAAVQAKIANLGADIEALRASSLAELQLEGDRIRRAADQELTRVEQHTLQEIEAASRQARLELRHYAAQLAVDLAEKKVRARMNPDADATLLHNFTAGLASEPASGPGQNA